jgi:hypothetical protein
MDAPLCRSAIMSLNFALLVTGPAYGTQTASTAYRFALSLVEQGHRLSHLFFYQEGVCNANGLHAPARSSLRNNKPKVSVVVKTDVQNVRNESFEVFVLVHVSVLSNLGVEFKRNHQKSSTIRALRTSPS